MLAQPVLGDDFLRIVTWIIVFFSFLEENGPF